MKKIKKTEHYLWGMVSLLIVMITAPVKADLIVLSYHETSHSLNHDKNFTAMAITTSELAKQFSWLKEHGYESVGIDDLLDAQKGKRALPDKAVLLTFDDAYRGMYEQVYPLLRIFDYQAVIAVVGKWIEVPASRQVMYGSDLIARKYFLNWDQIREMANSGYVEIASHSYNLHHGIIANPQKNSRPAAVSRHYNADTNSYESDEQYKQRIRNDLQRNSDLIARKTGHKPRVMVWPYGAYNRITNNIANEVGMPITMSLEDGPIDIKNLGSLNRLLIGHGITLADFVWQINNHYKPDIEPVRSVYLSLDDIYDPNPKQQEKNLGFLLDRVKAIKANTVYLSAYTDTNKDGNADALYFPNRHLPMQADLFSRVAWQLRTRTGVKVYASLPLMAYDFPLNQLVSKNSQQALQLVGDIYEDLTKYTHIDGLAFHYDSDQSNHESLNQWADALAERARLYRPTLKTVRNIHASLSIPELNKRK